MSGKTLSGVDPRFGRVDKGRKVARGGVKLGGPRGSRVRPPTGSMRERDDEPPLPPPSPAAREPSRLRRTLHTLRAPFRPGSPFHLVSIKRSGSGKSSASASDGDLARDERTMRKRNKKTRESAAQSAGSAVSDASRSTDSSPSIDNKKKEGGFMRRMGSIGKKRAEFTSAPSVQQRTKESSLESDAVPRSELHSSEASASKSPTPETPVSKESTPDITTSDTRPPEPPNPEPPNSLEPAVPIPSEPVPKLVPEPSTPEPVSPISVVHPVAIRPFTKAAWKRKKELEIQRPVEEPSPESALRRRIAFVAQASACLSEDRDDEAGGERGEVAVGSLEEAVALARVRLAPTASPSPAHSREATTEEEGYSDAMPAYGDLIEPSDKPGSESVSASCEHTAPRVAR